MRVLGSQLPHHGGRVIVTFCAGGAFVTAIRLSRWTTRAPGALAPSKPDPVTHWASCCGDQPFRVARAHRASTVADGTTREPTSAGNALANAMKKSSHSAASVALEALVFGF